MKVGTDGVLLGAWAEVADKNNILDVGSGSGLIALMIAQRTTNAQITALEIDALAYEESKGNFDKSPWKHRIFAQMGDFATYDTNKKFDLIVSNPPFFYSDTRSDKPKRALARSGTLPMVDFLFKAKTLMNPHSRLELILPFESWERIQIKAKEIGLFPRRLTRVIPTLTKPPHRVLVSFSLNRGDIITDELIIETGLRHQYSEPYKNLTRDFYLGF